MLGFPGAKLGPARLEVAQLSQGGERKSTLVWAPLDLWCLPHVPSRQHGPVLWRRAAGRDSREHLPRRYRPPSTPSPSAHLDHFACAVAFGPSVNAGPGFGRACECSCPAVEHRHRRPVVGAALCARARAVRLVALRPRRWRRTATRGGEGTLLLRACLQASAELRPSLPAERSPGRRCCQTSSRPRWWSRTLSR